VRVSGDGGDEGSGGMDLGITETARRRDGGIASEIDGKLEKSVAKVRGSNREGRHHMGNGLIGELHSGGPRTEVPVGPTAAIATGLSQLTPSPVEPVRDDAESQGAKEMEELESMLNLMQRDQMVDDQTAVLAIVRQLGGSSSKYLRERKRSVQRLVAEIYSPPRVTAAVKLLPELRCIPGFAFDITTNNENGEPWDFDIAENRRRARERVLLDKPMLLVGSPMCTAFSAWQYINNKKRDPTLVAKEYVRAMVHIRFVMELYAIQHAAGRYFLHEHPAGAMSWAEAEVMQIALMPNVVIVVGDQCQYNAEDTVGSPIKKPTKFMTNSSCIGDALSRRCSGKLGACSRPKGGHHALCNGARAKAAAIYPFALCRAILTGFRDQMVADGRLERGAVGLNCVMLDEQQAESRETHWYAGTADSQILKFKIQDDDKFVDDLTWSAARPQPVQGSPQERDGLHSG